MYKIMIVKSKKDNYASLYQFLTTTTDGVTTPLEIETKEALDARIETMLNDGGYSKSDFIIVTTVDYTVDATDYTDEDEEDSTTTDELGDDSGTTDDDESSEEVSG